MQKIRSIFGTALLFIGDTLLLVMLYPVLFILPQEKRRFVGAWWGSLSIWIMRLTCGLSYKKEGEGHLQQAMAQGTVILASRHQSAWDTMIYWHELRNVAFVYKKELDKVPILGAYLRRMGMVSIDRDQGAASVKKLLRQAKNMAKTGRPIVIFPEGTRSEYGEPATYNPGVAALYKSLNVPVIPVALNSGKYWGRRSLEKKRGDITLKYLEPIQPGLSKDDFMKVLTEQLETESAKL